MPNDLLGRAVTEARNDLATIDAARASELDAAKREIYARYSDRRSRAVAQLRAAEQAVEVAREAESRQHPWFGKRVYRTFTIGEADFGVVQVRAVDTVFPRNQTALPRMGDLFIRLIKANGELGQKFVQWDGRQDGKWHLDTKGDTDANG